MADDSWGDATYCQLLAAIAQGRSARPFPADLYSTDTGFLRGHFMQDVRLPGSLAYILPPQELKEGADRGVVCLAPTFAGDVPDLDRAVDAVLVQLRGAIAAATGAPPIVVRTDGTVCFLWVPGPAHPSYCVPPRCYVALRVYRGAQDAAEKMHAIAVDNEGTAWATPLAEWAIEHPGLGVPMIYRPYPVGGPFEAYDDSWWLGAGSGWQQGRDYCGCQVIVPDSSPSILGGAPAGAPRQRPSDHTAAARAMEHGKECRLRPELAAWALAYQLATSPPGVCSVEAGLAAVKLRAREERCPATREGWPPAVGAVWAKYLVAGWKLACVGLRKKTRDGDLVAAILEGEARDAIHRQEDDGGRPGIRAP